ncbi:MAG: hypothetical protein QNJ00_15830 [Woeseiaceae bacterium]|nr:hypothetical protein [Woeseiaceae bacterium]
MKTKALLLSVIACLLPLTASADNHGDRLILTDVWVVVPKQGMEAQFEEAASAHMAYRAEQGESRSWEAYNAIIGDNVQAVMFRACCFDWPDQDAYVEAMDGSEIQAHWADNVHQYVDDYHHYIEEYDYENSYWPESDDRGPYFGVTTWTWKEGAGPGPEAARTKLSQVALENGWGEAGNEWLWHKRIGGPPKLMIVTGFESYADMAPPEQSFAEFLSEHMDEDEMNDLFTTFGSGFSSSEYTVWRLNENLSTPGD